MHFSMRITIRIICILMRIPKHFSKCVSHAHCMRFRNAHYGKRIRSASDAFQKCASWLSHFMRIWKRIWNASLMRIKRFKWNGLMRFQMRINVHRGGPGLYLIAGPLPLPYCLAFCPSCLPLLNRISTPIMLPKFFFYTWCCNFYLRRSIFQLVKSKKYIAGVTVKRILVKGKNETWKIDNLEGASLMCRTILWF